MRFILRRILAFYDLLERFWTNKHTERFIANLLIMVFLGSIGLIELNRQGLLAQGVASYIPISHYYAINIAISMLLGFEVIGLVFRLAKSVAVSVGKQFEILSLIMLRHSFEELVHFNEPLVWDHTLEPVLKMLSNAGGALVIFMLVGFYYSLQRHRPITRDIKAAADFIGVKKIVSLLLLSIFFFIGSSNLYGFFTGTPSSDFFPVFYTILIFSDILLVFISLRYGSSYPIVFRNSGFAFATLLIRLALSAPPYINVLLGIGSVLFAIGITYAYNWYKKPQPPEHAGS